MGVTCCRWCASRTSRTNSRRPPSCCRRRVIAAPARGAQHDEERIDALEREIADIRASESWRIGQAALAPVRLVRRFRARVSR